MAMPVLSVPLTTGSTVFLVLNVMLLLLQWLQPVELWTGKQLFSVLVRPSAADRIFVNVAVAEKGYSKEGEAFCRNDGFVLFRNSELLAGQLGKATLGMPKSDFENLQQDFGAPPLIFFSHLSLALSLTSQCVCSLPTLGMLDP